jgi:hypothetical protein
MGVLPAPHRRFWSAVVAHRGQIDGRLRRIVSREMGRQVPLAEVSAVNTAPGEGIARDSRNGRRRKQGGSHSSRRSRHHFKLSLSDELPSTGSATSETSGLRSSAGSDYRPAPATHRTSTFRCRRRIPRPRRRARQKRARFRRISTRLISTHRPLFLGEAAHLYYLRGRRGLYPQVGFATTGRRT